MGQDQPSPAEDRKAKSSSPKPRQQPGSACEECRKRKLRCDRKQPQCGVCAESGAQCHIRTSCPPRGPKKGHLRILRSQIAALESRLDNQEKGIAPYSNHLVDPTAAANQGLDYKQALGPPTTNGPPTLQAPPYQNGPWSHPLPASIQHVAMPGSHAEAAKMHESNNLMQPELSIHAGRTRLADSMCNDLDQVYFERVHPFAPVLHKCRYYSWSKLADKTKPQQCLQNAMWVLAASVADEVQYVGDLLYPETRQLLDSLDMDETGVLSKSQESIQAWLLIAMHEIMSNKLQRGLVSAGRALRLIQIQHMYEIDKSGAVGGTIAGDWITAESARRTFWLAYVLERFLAINENISLTLNEQEIRTQLPAPEAHFQTGQATSSVFLSDFLVATAAHKEDEADSFHMAPLTECILVATTCGRSMVHRERSTEETFRQGITPDFLRRHQWLDTVLTARIRTLSIRTIPMVFESPDPSLIFATLAAHTTILYLCTIIEANATADGESQVLLDEYRHRAAAAVQEMCRIATMVKNMDQFRTHPLMPVPLLQCARFILAHASSRSQSESQLQELMGALDSLKVVNGMAQDFVQLIRSRMPELANASFE